MNDARFAISGINIVMRTFTFLLCIISKSEKILIGFAPVLWISLVVGRLGMKKAVELSPTLHYAK